jgi:hypothetical protein
MYSSINDVFLFIFVIASGEIDILRVRLKHYYKAQLTLSCENPMSMIEQHFEYIAVIDFEATCNHNQGSHFPHEIIEFPIVLIDVPKREIVRNFKLLIMCETIRWTGYLLGRQISIVLSADNEAYSVEFLH